MEKKSISDTVDFSQEIIFASSNKSISKNTNTILKHKFKSTNNQ